MLSDPLITSFYIVCFVCAVRGAIFGLTKALLRIFALSGAYLCAYIGYQPVSIRISQHNPIELPHVISHALAGCLCLLASFILFNIIAAGIHSIIKRPTLATSTNTLQSFASRTLAALISSAFGFGLCLSGLMGYLILSKHFPLPKIEPTATNQAFINFSKNVIRQIQTDAIPCIQRNESKPNQIPFNKMQPRTIQERDSIGPNASLKPLSLMNNEEDSMLMHHTISTKKHALEQTRNH